MAFNISIWAASQTGPTTASVQVNRTGTGDGPDEGTLTLQWGTTPGGPYPNTVGPQPAAAGTANQLDITGASTPSTLYFIVTYSSADQADVVTAELDQPMEVPDITAACGGAGQVGNHRMELSGSANDVPPDHTIGFRWGTTAGGPYPNTSAVGDRVAGTNSTSQQVDELITSLDRDTLYYFQTVVYDAGGTEVASSTQCSMRTRDLTYPVTCTGATDVTTTTATLNGDGFGMGVDHRAVVQWGTTPGGPYPNEIEGDVGYSSGTQPYSQPVTGLTQNTTYYFRTIARETISGDISGASEECTFLTLFQQGSEDGETSCAAASAVSSNSATLNGTGTGVPTDHTVGFRWGTSAGGPYPNETPDFVAGDTTTGQTFTSTLTGLSPNTQYYYQAIEKDENGVVTGTALGNCTFTTEELGAVSPTVECDGVINENIIEATFTGLGHDVPTDHTLGFAWGTTMGGPYPNVTADPEVGDATTNQPYQKLVSGLSSATTYYFVSQVYDAGGAVVASSDECTFTTSAGGSVVVEQIRKDNVTSDVEAGNYRERHQDNVGTLVYELETLISGIDAVDGIELNDTMDPTVTPDAVRWEIIEAEGVFGIAVGDTGTTFPITFDKEAVSNARVHVRVEYDLPNGTRTGAILNTVGVAVPGQPEETGTNNSFNVFTAGCAPTTDITDTSARLHGVSEGMAAGSRTIYEWGTTDGGPYTNQGTQVLFPNVGFTANGLTPATPYFHRFRVIDPVTGDTIWTSPQCDSFTTNAAAIPPTVECTGSSAVTPTTATLAGTAHNATPQHSVRFCWGPVGGPFTTCSAGVPGNGAATQNYSANVTGDFSTPGQYQAQVLNGLGDIVATSTPCAVGQLAQAVSVAKSTEGAATRNVGDVITSTVTVEILNPSGTYRQLNTNAPSGIEKWVETVPGVTYQLAANRSQALVNCWSWDNVGAEATWTENVQSRTWMRYQAALGGGADQDSDWLITLHDGPDANAPVVATIPYSEFSSIGSAYNPDIHYGPFNSGQATLRIRCDFVFPDVPNNNSIMTSMGIFWVQPVDFSVSDPVPAAPAGTTRTWTMAATTDGQLQNAPLPSGTGDINDGVITAVGRNHTITYTIMDTVNATGVYENTATVNETFPGTNTRVATGQEVTISNNVTGECDPATAVTSGGCTLNGHTDAPTGFTSRIQWRKVPDLAWTDGPVTTHASPATMTAPVTGSPEDQFEYRVQIEDETGAEVFASPPCSVSLLAATGPNIELEKVTVPGPYTAPAMIVSTVTVRNTGGAAGSTNIDDVIPANPVGTTRTYESVATGGASGNTLVGSGDIHDQVNLPAGSTIVYTIRDRVVRGGLYENIVVKSGGPETTGGPRPVTTDPENPGKPTANVDETCAPACAPVATRQLPIAAPCAPACGGGAGTPPKDVETLILCDKDAEGNVIGTAMAVYTYDENGVPEGPPTFVDPATGDPYTVVGTLSPCEQCQIAEPKTFFFTSSTTGPVDFPGRSYSGVLPISRGYTVDQLSIGGTNYPVAITWSILDTDGADFATALAAAIQSRIPSSNVTVTPPPLDRCDTANQNFSITIDCIDQDIAPNDVTIRYDSGTDLVRNPAQLNDSGERPVADGQLGFQLRQDDDGTYQPQAPHTLDCSNTANQGWNITPKARFETWGDGFLGVQPGPRGGAIIELNTGANPDTLWQVVTVPADSVYTLRAFVGGRRSDVNWTIRLSTGNTGATGGGDIANINVTTPPVGDTGAPQPWTRVNQDSISLTAGTYTLSMTGTGGLGALYTDLRLFTSTPNTIQSLNADDNCINTREVTTNTVECQDWIPQYDGACDIIGWRKLDDGTFLSQTAFFAQVPAPVGCYVAPEGEAPEVTFGNLVHTYSICAGGMQLQRTIITDNSGQPISEEFRSSNGELVSPPANYTIGSCPNAPDIEISTVCADGATAFRQVTFVNGAQTGVTFFGADGAEITPTTWTPGECATPVGIEIAFAPLGCTVDAQGEVTGRVFTAETVADTAGGANTFRMVHVSTAGVVTDPYTGTWANCPTDQGVRTQVFSEAGCANGVPYTRRHVQGYDADTGFPTGPGLDFYVDSAGTISPIAPAGFTLGACAVAAPVAAAVYTPDVRDVGAGTTFTVVPGTNLVSVTLRNRSATNATYQVNGGQILTMDPGETWTGGGVDEEGGRLAGDIVVAAGDGVVRVTQIRRN